MIFIFTSICANYLDIFLQYRYLFAHKPLTLQSVSPSICVTSQQAATKVALCISRGHYNAANLTPLLLNYRINVTSTSLHGSTSYPYHVRVSKSVLKQNDINKYGWSVGKTLHLSNLSLHELVRNIIGC